MGYTDITMLGFLRARAPVTGDLEVRRAAVPWASRFEPWCAPRMTDPTTDIDEAMARAPRGRGPAAGRRGPSPPPSDIATLPRFGGELPSVLDPEQQAQASSPRPITSTRGCPTVARRQSCSSAAHRTTTRAGKLGKEVPADLSGKRVLDVGSNAGYDPFMFSMRGAEYVLGAEPFMFIEQARFLERIYQTGVDFQPLGWQDLDPAVHGTFDLVHCHGVLYHDMHPMAMLQRLRQMLAPGGTLYFGSMMLADPELSEYARFVPGAYYEDATWWWVPGRLAMRWMLESVGLTVRRQLALHDGPPGEFATINGYFECELGDPSPLEVHVERSSGATPGPAAR